jgi:hypothetical protein
METLQTIGAAALCLAIFFAWEWVKRGPGGSPWSRRW